MTATPTDERMTVGTDELTVRVRSAHTGGALFAAEVRMGPGGGPPVMHRHPPGELYHVLDGEFTLHVADAAGTVRRTVAGPGAVVPIAGGVPHTIRNESPAPATALVVWAPGEAMERFTRAAAALAAQGPAAMDEVLALAARHGIEVTGPVPGDD
jgi:oxalate decarboxylase/phosphoglucose isomerase-like protein (cupin superfamily)